MVFSDLSLEGIYFIFTYVIVQTCLESLPRYCYADIVTQYGMSLSDILIKLPFVRTFQIFWIIQIDEKYPSAFFMCHYI